MNAQVEPLLDDPIEIALAEGALELAKKRSKWNAIKDFYRPIVNALHRLGVEPRLSGDVDIHFSGDAQKLAAVVRILRTAGFATTAERPKAGDTSWCAYFKHPQCGTDVYMYFTSSVCRRVKVGTKMVEQDIYEVQCGDISSVEPPALTIVPAAPQIPDEIPF
jgi:hypothetical protein